MKKSRMLLFPLFSFDYKEKEVVDVYSCENNTLRIKQDANWFNVKLFNVNLDENTNICTYINGEVSVEFEEAIQFKEPYEVYVFVNDTLLQEKLIDEEKATIKINSPAYKYDLNKQKEMVMAEIKEEDIDVLSSSRISAILLLCLWGILVVRIVVKKYKRS